MSRRQFVFGPALGLVFAALLVGPARAEDGHELWLRHAALQGAARSATAQQARGVVSLEPDTPTLIAAVEELQRGVKGLTGREPARSGQLGAGTLVLARPATLAKRGLNLKLDGLGLGAEGYLLRHVTLQGKPLTVIAANTDIGLLYGSFAWLRAVETGAELGALDQTAAPRIERRLLNHWDNLDRTVERGYAGSSLWDWWRLPELRDPRYVEYARANASLGINGTVLNNVNAKAESLSRPYLLKAAALADVLRPYGVRVYLSARFSSPIELGGLHTADPLDPAVRAWWKRKIDEIYTLIPDFGGLLVKANSEGQPGPQDYGRSHADGANMLAQSLAPHGGIVMWRAFVYSQHDADDRAKQAYNEFQPLDGQFAPNVCVQVKNGAIDFQPREPLHPLFGAMPKTALALEVQITKEYLGFSTHLAYLGSLFEEVLKADTGYGTTAGQLLITQKPSVFAGVANIGTDRNWTGSQFDQANWYAFGRMAWDPQLSSVDVAREWIAQTWGTQPQVQQTILAMMTGSREAVVDYMTPLGLHHLMGSGHHYGPAPWVNDLERPDWNPVYYHRAGIDGIGFDRSPTGSKATEQYAPALAKLYADVHTTPEALLLWFHHVPWDYKMRSGRTLWAELIEHYDRGVSYVGTMRAQWGGLRGKVDAERYAEVAATLGQQEREARWWRDACLAYFQSVSGQAWPAGERRPELSLSEYQGLRFRFVPGHH